MGLGDVAGIFSRYFVVGFLLPSFFVLVVLSQALADSLLPAVYLEASSAGRILIVGGAALLVGLVLLGLHYQVLRLLEGYPLVAAQERPLVRNIYRRLRDRELARFRRAEEACEDPNASDAERGNAKWRLDQQFPHERASLLLPTRFGNAIRAFERHPQSRWGLNGIAAWTRIEMLLSAEETQVHAETKEGMSFFANFTILLPLAGLALIVDAIAYHGADALYLVPLYLIGFALALAASYRAAVSSAIGWGSSVRSSFDIHRRDLYRRLGVRLPASFSEERDVIGPAVSGALLRGEPIPDALAAVAESAEDELPANRRKERANGTE